MGHSINVRCKACGFSGEEQSWGPGMAMPWDFFEYRLFRCVPCERLESGYVIKTLPALRRAATTTATDHPGPFRLTREELAGMLVEARERPKCSGCGKALGGRSVGGGGVPKRCPSCGGALKVTQGTVLFD